MKKIIMKICTWARSENGFEVFERFGLTQGGVLLALGVTAVAVYFMSTLWNTAGDKLGEDGLGSLAPATLAEYQAQGWIQ